MVPEGQLHQLTTRATEAEARAAEAEAQAEQLQQWALELQEEVQALYAPTASGFSEPEAGTASKATPPTAEEEVEAAAETPPPAERATKLRPAAPAFQPSAARLAAAADGKWREQALAEEAAEEGELHAVPGVEGAADAPEVEDTPPGHQPQQVDEGAEAEADEGSDDAEGATDEEDTQRGSPAAHHAQHGAEQEAGEGDAHGAPASQPSPAPGLVRLSPSAQPFVPQGV